MPAYPQAMRLDLYAQLLQARGRLDGLTLNVTRAANRQTALCVEQATFRAHTPPRPLNQGADALIPLTEAIATLRSAIVAGPRRLDQQARAAQALHLTRTLRQRPLTDEVR